MLLRGMVRMDMARRLNAYRCQATPRFTKYGDTRFARGTVSSRAGRADRKSLRALGSDVRPV
jgi:hypothetical protein